MKDHRMRPSILRPSGILVGAVALAALAGSCSEEPARTVSTPAPDLPPAAVARTGLGGRQAPPADYRPSNTWFNNLPGNWPAVQPRTDWATPFARGPLRLLLVLPVKAAHEAVELRARIPCSTSLITLQEPDAWAKPGAEPAYNLVPSAEALDDTADRLLGTGHAYDAIVCASVRWPALPASVRERIAARTRAGGALVLVSPWELDAGLLAEARFTPERDAALAADLARSIPLGLLPLDQEERSRRIGPLTVRLGSLGAGTLAVLDYRGLLLKDGRTTVFADGWWRHLAEHTALTPVATYDPLFYDYYHGILGKVLYAAAGKTSSTVLRADSTAVAIPRTGLPAAPAVFRVSGAVPGDGLYLYELRDRQGRVLVRDSAAGLGGAFAPRLPVLSLGTYVVDVWAMRQGAVLDWASVAVTVTGERRILAIQPAKPAFSCAEPITGRLLPGPAAAGVRLDLRDTHGRLLATTAPDAGGAFAFPPVRLPLSRTCRIIASTDDGDGAECWVGLPSNAVEEFHFIMWGNALPTRANLTFLEQFRRCGVTGYYDYVTWMQPEQIVQSADNLARHDLVANPYTTGCWSFAIAPRDRTFHGSLAEIIAADAREYLPARIAPYRPYGTLAYSVCEENSIERNDAVWDNPVAAADRAAWLAARYGDIASLNRAWNSSFADFAAITPIGLLEAKTTHQPTRWLEQERWKVDRFNTYHEAVAAIVGAEDPGSRQSLDCTEGMDFDWPRMAKTFKVGSQSPLEAFNTARGDLNSTWTGSYSYMLHDEWRMRTTPWQQLFQGGSHLLWWTGDIALSADLSEPLEGLRWTAEEVRDICAGIGRLLMSARRRIAPVRVLWSNTSYYAGLMHPQALAWDDARKRFETLLPRLGIAAQWVGEDYIDRDLAFAADCTTLILPACQAISRQGIERIRAFAQAGGLVIADFPPATFDERLIPYVAAAADQAPTTFSTCPRCKGAKRIEVGNIWQACPTCGGVGSIATGTEGPRRSALEDLFDLSSTGVRKLGKGHGLFLNGPPDRRETWGALRRVLIEHGGVADDLRLVDATGGPRTDLRHHVFDAGPACFLGVLPESGMPAIPGPEFGVRLARPMHAYDVRSHRYLGRANAFQAGLLPCMATLLAFLPERLDGFTATLAKPIFAPGEVVEVRGGILPAALADVPLILHIEVAREGAVLDEFTRNLPFRSAFATSFPLALDQPPGDYRIRCIEVISGHTLALPFVVQ